MPGNKYAKGNTMRVENSSEAVKVPGWLETTERSSSDTIILGAKLAWFLPGKSYTNSNCSYFFQ